ncbi:MAG: hypothetical protein Q9225_006604, partial [Loekoesia sp. 1 TL-2023]
MCDVECLIHDEANGDLARKSADTSETALKTLETGAVLPKDLGCQRTIPSSEHEASAQSANDTAFLFHTSGTSGGLPKPIPQTHHGAVGVLPCLPNGHEKATFTTTPLYHGGIADCFRAWTSGALIWLFPGKDIPITASNILRCLGCAKREEKMNNAAPVKYFSSVPYVLQMISAEPEGMRILQEMDVVGVGGAALPQDVGDSLVHNGVNLVSRFGSAECGFLLSSHRNYKVDQEWQYLRSHGSNLLKFEKQHDGSGLSELVIRSDWPHMAKRNRKDGSFATADLFAPHPALTDAWKYHSRADSQLTLITGKKFDPAPLEAAISSSDLLSDVLIFGNGKQCPGALVFRSDMTKNLDGGRLLDEIWPVVDKLNKEGQQHTRLSRSMLTVMDGEAPGLEKSSKGTVLRVQAEKKFQKEIEGAYNQAQDSVNGDNGLAIEIVSEQEVPTAVLEIIRGVLGTSERIPEDADLFSYGVDSVSCMAIRAKLQSVRTAYVKHPRTPLTMEQNVIGQKAPELPLNVVYDCGTMKRLSKYLLDIRQGRMTKSEDELQLMRAYVNQYSKFSIPQVSLEGRNSDGGLYGTDDGQFEQLAGERVILTGATGALGAHILHLLRSSPGTFHITCLVRAASPLAAHERVSKSLTARGKPGLPLFSKSDASSPRITCFPTTLSHSTLGLDPKTYTHLAKTTTLIIHAAWAVNFTARLRSFEKDHIAGLSHLLSLASSSAHQPSFLFLSSTASVTSSSTTNPIPERLSHNPGDASPLGYSRSKWVAEQICNNFYSTRKAEIGGPRIAVLRIGQLCGDTETGIWNMSEAYPLMLSTAPALNALPDLGQMPLDWMPVERAAGSVLEVAESLLAGADNGEEKGGDKEIPVFHILNPHNTPTWRDLVKIVQRLSPEMQIEVLPPREWLGRLEEFEGDVPAKKLVG